MSRNRGFAAPEGEFDQLATSIDFSLPFVPESLTQLYYTPALARLSPAQRLRYNQLYAAHVNEQFIFFEHEIGNAIARALLRPGAVKQPSLRNRLQVMVDDEERHQCMFESINRRAIPELYANGRHFFIRPSAIARFLLKTIVAHPKTLTFVIWLAFFLEEASAEFSKAVIKSAQEGVVIEPNFLAVHLRHLRDEVHHIKLYPEIVRSVVANSSALARKINGMMLARLMREFLAPKRSGIAVIDRLVIEFPDLNSMHGDLRRDVRSLAGSPDFYDAFFAVTKLPFLHRMFEEFPEFSWSAAQAAAQYR
ncbi:MAG: diiron oxygenase [Candidatus Accumulibacter sp.]|nr:diiron oxygenase [Accumulibacter sp.]